MRARAGLAETQQEAGRLDDALATFREALTIRPKDADLNHGYGVGLMEKGRLAEAANHFRTALAAEPAQAKSWMMLSQVKPQREPDNELAAMEAQHVKAPADSLARMQLSFGLANCMTISRSMTRLSTISPRATRSVAKASPMTAQGRAQNSRR